MLGALVIAFSAILVDLAKVSPAAAAFFRCGYALPPLLALALWEDRRHGRRAWRDRRLAIPSLFDTSLVATLAAGAYMLATADGDIVPSWPSAGWLVTLALSCQVLGWLLITVSLPRLPAAMTSLTLTVQPIASVALGAILLGQDPSALQLAGVACILAGLLSVAVRRRAPVYAAVE